MRRFAACAALLLTAFVTPAAAEDKAPQFVFSPDAAQTFIYMIDGMNGEVRVVDRATKEVVSRFGRPGRQVGQFTALHNIAVDRQGNIYTGEYRTARAEIPPARRAELGNAPRTAIKFARRSACDLERLGQAGADRLRSLIHHFLGERGQFLELSGGDLELLALMIQRQLEQFGQRLHYRGS